MTFIQPPFLELDNYCTHLFDEYVMDILKKHSEKHFYVLDTNNVDCVYENMRKYSDQYIPKIRLKIEPLFLDKTWRGYTPEMQKKMLPIFFSNQQANDIHMKIYEILEKNIIRF